MKKRFIAALFLGAAIWGCASQEGVVREGARYGVTKGVFHGRWWNYYERGCSYLTGQFYAEAEADFRKAAVGRSRDTWQARTYGLHFVEYFPNRELGVACYHLGRLDEAEQHLTTSLSQIDTDRAHHYLDLVKKARIVKGEIKSDTAPTIETSATEGQLLSSRELPLKIQASDAVGVAQVSINGSALPQRGSVGTFSAEDRLILAEGTHEIRVDVANLADKQTSRTIRVEVDLTGPTIGVVAPLDGTVTEAETVRVSGICVDKNGVVSIAVGDRSLAEAKGDKRIEFASEFPLASGENVFVITAKDRAGNETRSAVRVFRGSKKSAAAILWRRLQLAPESLVQAQAGVDPSAAVLLEGTEPSAQGPVSIAVKSPSADRPYRHNKMLCVAGEVRAATKVASLTINGAPFEELTGAPKESFNRRIPIDDADGGEKKIPVKIAARDDQGHEASQAIEVSVRPVHLDSRESKMPVAVLAFAGNGIDPALAELLRTTTEAKLQEAGRFRVLDRTRLQDVLTEQQIAAALADPNEAIRLGKMTNAQVFIVADVFARDRNGIEVKARAVSPETTDVVATLDAFADDKNDARKVDGACKGLAAALEKAFPRLSGELLAVRPKADGSEMLVNWTKEDGVHEGMYMLVVKEDEPWVDQTTGEVLEPGEAVEVARGRIERILNNGSQAKEVKQETGEAKLEQGMAAITM